MVSVVSRKYSEALFLVGQKKSALETYENEILELKEIFNMNKEIMKSLCHPHLPLENKIQIVDALFNGKVSKEVVAFLNVILRKGRQEYIVEIFDAYIDKCKKEKNISKAVVMTAEKLDKKHIDRIQKELENKMVKKIEIEEKIDDRLIGGVKIIVDNILFDSSIDGKIKNIYKAIS